MTEHGATPSTSGPDMSVRLGPLVLPTPVVAASGTFGNGDEVARLCDPQRIGAVTVKSVAPFEWAGNPAPRLAGVTAGMVNSVGLPGPGVERWCEEHLPKLRQLGARVIAAIWGRTVDDYALAAKQLHGVRNEIVALEVNVSCPNTEDGARMFAQSPEATRAVLAAVREVLDGVPLFAKLTAAVTAVADIAAAALDGGTDGFTLVNTVPSLAIDAESRTPLVANGIGGLSGTAIKPIALRAVHDVYSAFPEVPIIGTGGVMTGEDAVEMMLAGASAVGVGTATFLDPRATIRIQDELARWCAAHGVREVVSLTGGLRWPSE